MCARLLSASWCCHQKHMATFQLLVQIKKRLFTRQMLANRNNFANVKIIHHLAYFWRWYFKSQNTEECFEKNNNIVSKQTFTGGTPNGEYNIHFKTGVSNLFFRSPGRKQCAACQNWVPFKKISLSLSSQL